MDMLITDTERKTAYGNEYLYVEMTCGKHSALVIVCRGVTSYVHVKVMNAASRAWRGVGKRFPTVEAALAAYKTNAVRSMIETAYAMA